MKTLLCFGDSNTHGTAPMAELSDRRRYDHQTRWPALVARSLGSAWNVVEEGHPGRTTVMSDPIEGDNKSGLASLSVALESHRPIDLVLIMLGTNDLKTRFSSTSFDIALSVEQLVVVARQSQCGPDMSAPDVLLIAPPPILEVGRLAELFEGGAAKSQKLATLYREAAERQNCAFMDAGSVIESSSVDGIHLEPAAHAALGQAVADVISRGWSA